VGTLWPPLPLTLKKRGWRGGGQSVCRRRRGLDGWRGADFRRPLFPPHPPKIREISRSKGERPLQAHGPSSREYHEWRQQIRGCNINTTRCRNVWIQPILKVGKIADVVGGVVSLHARLSAQDFGPTLTHLINLCSSPSKLYAEFVMNFGMFSLKLWG
jgi:hypothetical protein